MSNIFIFSATIELALVQRLNESLKSDHVWGITQ